MGLWIPLFGRFCSWTGSISLDCGLTTLLFNSPFFSIYFVLWYSRILEMSSWTFAWFSVCCFLWTHYYPYRPGSSLSFPRFSTCRMSWGWRRRSYRLALGLGESRWVTLGSMWHYHKNRRPVYKSSDSSRRRIRAKRIISSTPWSFSLIPLASSWHTQKLALRVEIWSGQYSVICCVSGNIFLFWHRCWPWTSDEDYTQSE